MATVLAVVAVASAACDSQEARPPDQSGPTSTAAADSRFTAVAENGVPNRFLVTLSDDLPAERVEQLGKELTAKHNGKLGWIYKATVKGFATNMAADDARALSREPGVVRVDQDVYAEAASVQSNAPAHLDRVDQRGAALNQRYNAAGTPPGTGPRPRVYIIDSGINVQHKEFGGRARMEHIFAPPEPDAPPNLPFGGDCHGHGTHVAALAAGATHGIAQTAEIIGLKITNTCTATSTRIGDLAMAVDHIAATAPKHSVVNLSYGYGASSSAVVLEEAIKRATLAGIPFIVSAGNEGTDACTRSPARVPEAYTVAALAPSDKRALFSNWGSCVDIFAPGYAVRSASHKSNDGMIAQNGTSMAAPQVAGAAALIQARNAGAPLRPAALFALLNKEATAGVVLEANGSPSRLLHVGGYYRGTGGSIPDRSTAASGITVADQADTTAAATVAVDVSITHADRTQLTAFIVRPDGSRVQLTMPRHGHGPNSIRITQSISGAPARNNGTWRLEVVDAVAGTTGRIDFWTLRL
ncbi:S8 family serine peptidase [Actinokineospora sp. 24-640]